MESSKLPRECVGGPGLWHHPLLHPYHRTCYQRTTLPVLHLLWVVFLRLWAVCAQAGRSPGYTWHLDTGFVYKLLNLQQIALRTPQQNWHRLPAMNNPTSSSSGAAVVAVDDSTRDSVSGYTLQFFYGIVLALIGSSLQAFGLCLWKLHSTWHARHQEQCAGKALPDTATGLLTGQAQGSRVCAGGTCPYTPTGVDCGGFSWVWLTGFCIFVFGNACDFVALGIAPLSIVTLLGSWSLVVNTVTAHFLLHEVVAHLDQLSIIFIVTGIILTVRKN